MNAAGGFYTLASWYVRAGAEEEFLRAWRDELAAAFRAASPEACGTLVQDLQDPRQFYSFGPWPNEAAMEAARGDPAVSAALGRLVALCERATPGRFRVVLEIS